MKLHLVNGRLHRHLGIKGWCDCRQLFNPRSSLSFKGWIKLIFLTNIYII